MCTITEYSYGTCVQDLSFPLKQWLSNLGTIANTSINLGDTQNKSVCGFSDQTNIQMKYRLDADYMWKNILHSKHFQYNPTLPLYCNIDVLNIEYI